MNRLFSLLLLAAFTASAQQVMYLSPSGNALAYSAGCLQSGPCPSWSNALVAFHVGKGGSIIRPAEIGGYGPIIDTLGGQTPTGIVIDGGGIGSATIGSTFAGDPNQPPLGDVAAAVLTSDATLRNLTIVLPGDATSQHVGIWIHGGHVRLENVVITGPGILVGVLVTGGATVSMNNVTIKGTNGTAVYVSGGNVSLRDCILDGHGAGSTGVFVSAAAGPIPGVANVERTELTRFGNAIGVDGTSGAASLRLSNSVVTGNLLSMATSGGGTVTSMRNNTIEGNQTNTLTPFTTSLK